MLDLSEVDRASRIILYNSLQRLSGSITVYSHVNNCTTECLADAQLRYTLPVCRV